MTFIKLSEFQNTYFKKGSTPSKTTLIKLIEGQELVGKRIGNNYFIDKDVFESPALVMGLMH